MAVSNDHQAVLEDVTFPRREKIGVVLGLDVPGMISVFVCMVLMIVAVAVVPFPWGLVFSVVVLMPAAVLLGWFRLRGKRIFEWAKLGGVHMVRTLNSQNTYRRPGPRANAPYEAKMEAQREAKDAQAEKEAVDWDEPVPAKTPKPMHLGLPGAADELKVYETPSGYGVVHDPSKKRVIISAKMNSLTNYTLQDDSQQGSVLDDWANLISMICSHHGVVGAVATDLTTVITGEQMQRFYQEKATSAGAGEALNPVAHQGYLDLLAESDMTHHPQYLTVSLSIPEMTREIKDHGSGVAGLLGAAEARMQALEKDIEDNNHSIAGWVSAQERPAMLYETFSPSPMGITDETRASYGGPMGARRYWDHMRTDAHWHRAFVIEEWPVKPTRPGFLEKVILDLKFRHAVSLVMTAGEDDAAMRQINNAIKDSEMQKKVSEQSGRRVTLEMEREHEDLLDREAELVAGATDMNFRGFISITADSEEDLDRYTAQLRSAAARAHLKVEVAYANQYESWMAATGVLGFGLD